MQVPEKMFKPSSDCLFMKAKSNRARLNYKGIKKPFTLRLRSTSIPPAGTLLLHLLLLSPDFLQEPILLPLQLVPRSTLLVKPASKCIIRSRLLCLVVPPRRLGITDG